MTEQSSAILSAQTEGETAPRRRLVDKINEAALQAATQLADVANLFGYGEIKPHGTYSWSSMLELYKDIQADHFVTVKIHEKEDLWPAFRYFLGKEKISVGSR